MVVRPGWGVGSQAEYALESSVREKERMRTEESKGRAPAQQCVALRFETREYVGLKSAITCVKVGLVRQHAHVSQTRDVVTDGWMR